MDVVVSNCLVGLLDVVKFADSLPVRSTSLDVPIDSECEDEVPACVKLVNDAFVLERVDVVLLGSALRDVTSMARNREKSPRCTTLLDDPVTLGCVDVMNVPVMLSEVVDRPVTLKGLVEVPVSSLILEATKVLDEVDRRPFLGY